ncbi:MAG: hypothetical protein KKE93_01330 [Nanoarchaeota archaeon]|nr:hypothetical protein [Nanoarchaeota archaeon]
MDKKLPKPTTGDKFHTGIKAGLSAVPSVGCVAAELFNSLFKSPLEKRRDKWLEELSEELIKLQDEVKDLSWEKLSKNELFISTVMQASQIAMRNHQKEKKLALLNAIKNTAIGKTPEENIQMMFLNYIDTLTPWHLKILKYLQNPKEWGIQNKITYPNWPMGGPATVLEFAFPDLKDKREVYTKLIRDLENYGLVGKDVSSRMHTTVTADGMFQGMTTTFGNQFIKFISS